MSLNDYVIKKNIEMQNKLPNMFMDALKKDMRDYVKKQGRKPSVDEVVAEFEKNPFIMSLSGKYLGMDSNKIRSMVEEVLKG